MFKDFRRTIEDSLAREEERKLQEKSMWSETALNFAHDLNGYLLENKYDLENLLKTAGKKAEANPSNRRGSDAFYVGPAMQILKSTKDGCTKTLLVGYSAPERYYKPELIVEVYWHVWQFHRWEDQLSKTCYGPTNDGFVVWPYANGYLSNSLFINELSRFTNFPSIEKINGDLVWQARKISWKFK